MTTINPKPLATKFSQNLQKTGLLAATLIAFPAASFAQETLTANESSVSVSPATVSFDLPKQFLADALRSIGDQTNRNIFFDPKLVAGIQTAPLKAQLTPEEAIKALLKNTNLTYTRTDQHTYTIITQVAQTSENMEHESASNAGALRLAQNAGADGGQSNVQQNAEGAGNSSHMGSEESKAESGGAGEEYPLQEIIVTAQKRQERLQDVPISISVLSGDDLDKSTAQGITEALTSVPGVAPTVAAQGGGTLVSIRGVAAGGPVFNGSSPVAYYLDSVPFGLVKTAFAPDASAYDLERVEVLRGPQSTLYGANAQNGVVRILTKDASLADFEFKTRVSAASTDHGGESYRGDMAVNVPVVDGKVAARAVLGYQDWGGWIDRPNKSDANDAKIRNMRLKLKGKPNDALSIGLLTWFSRAEYGAPSTSVDNRQRPSIEDESISTDYDAYGLTIGYAGASFFANSMTSYLDFSNTGSGDNAPSGGFPYTLFSGFDAKVFSQEVILNSGAEGVWRWSLGAFYRDGEDRLRQSITAFNIFLDYTNGSESYAVFGEIGHRFFGDKFEWTLGARYFADDVFVRENRAIGFPNGGIPLVYVEDSFNSATPRAVLTWHPGVHITVYGSYSEGFRSGFPQDPGVIRPYPGFPSVKSDTLHNYELGAKGDVLDRRLSFEAALYYIDWQDVQQHVGVPIGNGLNTSALINGVSASGIGVDLGAVLRPFDTMELGVSFNWSDLAMDANVFSAESTGQVLLFAVGDRLNFSPKHTAGAFANYDFPLGSRGLNARFSASAGYTSEQSWRTIISGARAIAVGDSMLIGRTSLAIDSADRWAATLFVDNVTNEQGSPSDNPFDASGNSKMRVRPRTIGLQFDYHW